MPCRAALLVLTAEQGLVVLANDGTDAIADAAIDDAFQITARTTGSMCSSRREHREQSRQRHRESPESCGTQQKLGRTNGGSGY